MFSFNVHRLSFIVNNKCNMSCKHCFQHNSYRHDHQLSISDAINFCNFFLKIKTYDTIEITLIGGEPTLYTEWLEFKKCINLLVDNGIKFSTVRLFTNGAVINTDLIELLQYMSVYSQSVDIWLTKDLDPEYSDREYNGRSINKQIDRNASVYARYGFNVNYQSIFTKSNVPRIKNILNNIYHDKTLNLEFGYPCDPTYDIDKYDMINLIDASLDFINTHDVDIDFIHRTNMWNKIVTSNYQRMHYPTCDPIKGELSISPKGYIIPCVKCLDIENMFEKYHIKKLVLNHFLNDEFINKFIAIDDISDCGSYCKSCVVKEACVPCRLTLDLVNLNDKKKIYHNSHKCDRVIIFYKLKVKMIQEYIENGGKNLWLEK